MAASAAVTVAMVAVLLAACSNKPSIPPPREHATDPASGAQPSAAPTSPGATTSAPASAATGAASKTATTPDAGSAETAPRTPSDTEIAASVGLEIVDRPIDYGDERKRLTIEYRRAHQDPTIDSVVIAPEMIVLHYTTGNSATGTWRYFNKLRMERGREKLARAGDVNVSAHFVVDRDGTVYRLVPETFMARHCIGLNHIAIGVENVGDNDKYPLTDAQVEADARLIRYLVKKHGIRRLIGHHESRKLVGTPLYVERDPEYRNSKPDPGPEFMVRVRARVADLGLEGVPASSPRR